LCLRDLFGDIIREKMYKAIKYETISMKGDNNNSQIIESLGFAE